MEMDRNNPLYGLVPADPLMAGAWLGSIRYALTRDDIMATFREETGFHWKPGKTVMDRMVDDATGVPVEFLKAFAKWHNENIWGEEEGHPIDAPDPMPNAQAGEQP